MFSCSSSSGGSSGDSLRTRPTTRLPIRRPLEALEYAARLVADRAGDGQPEEPDREELGALCSATLAALDAVGVALVAAVPGGAPFDLEGNPTVDLVAVGQWTLERKRGNVKAALAGGDPARTQDACTSARRAALRVLAALENDLRSPGAPPGAASHALAEETKHALQVRRLYRAFRASLHAEAPPLSARTDAGLASVVGALAAVVGSPIWAYLRAGDRRLFREIAGRFQAIRGGQEQSVAAGLRVWQDVTAFADCLRAINHRPELVDHDRRLMASVLAALPAADEAPVHDSVIEALGPLLGRDDTLDDLLRSPAVVRAGTLRSLLA